MVSFVFMLALLAQDPPAAPAADAPASPQPAATPAAPAPVAVDDDARVVCVMEIQSGSHFKRKTCLTRAQWKKRRERDKAVADRALSIETSD